MFDRELTELTFKDRQRIEKMLEGAVRDVVGVLDANNVDSMQLLSKCATLKAVFKLAAILRQDTAAKT